MHIEVETGTKLLDMKGHNGDVAALSLCPTENNTFVTGSVDRTARIWDLRTPGCTQTLWGHESDVNSVSFHSSGVMFVTCSEDKTVRLWDIRSDQVTILLNQEYFTPKQFYNFLLILMQCFSYTAFI